MERHPGACCAPSAFARTTRSCAAMGSGSSPSTAPADAAAAAEVQNASDAERRLDLLLHDVEELAPLLSRTRGYGRIGWHHVHAGG